MKKKSLKDCELIGKKILLRVDFNVPMTEKGEIRDDTRIKLCLPTIEYLLNSNCSIIIISHFGRPNGSFADKYSLAPCAKRLSELLKHNVKFGPYPYNNQLKEKIKKLQKKEIILLENLRFNVAEEKPHLDLNFAKDLSTLADVYVNDAFGSSHRSHSSVVEITKYFNNTSLMGLLLEKEIFHLKKVISSPNKPFYTIIGGAKLGSKLGVLKTLIEKVDAMFIGGGMAYTFFKAMGISIGQSIVDLDKLEYAKMLIQETQSSSAPKIQLPIDCVITDGKKIKTIDISNGIPDGWEGMDIGEKTVEKWSNILMRGSTIFWNGPLGVFEDPNFAQGTKNLAMALSKNSNDVIIGGGDLVAAIGTLHSKLNFTHISSGGGACLEFIEKGSLPGITALSNKENIL